MLILMSSPVYAYGFEDGMDATLGYIIVLLGLLLALWRPKKRIAQGFLESRKTIKGDITKKVQLNTQDNILRYKQKAPKLIRLPAYKGDADEQYNFFQTYCLQIVPKPLKVIIFHKLTFDNL